MRHYWLISVLMMAFVQAAAADELDLAVVNRIKTEAFTNSHVMDYMHYLADENGPRLAGSPEYRRAAEWAVAALKADGISDARLEPFGDIGRSWSYSRVAVQMMEPQQTTLVAVPVAFSSGTDGPVEASAVYAPLWDSHDAPGQADLVKIAEQVERYKARYRGKLAGRIVLLSPKRTITLPSEPEIQRWNDAELEEKRLARDPWPGDLYEWPRLSMPTDPDESMLMDEILPIDIQTDFSRRAQRLEDRLIRFLNEEGVTAIAQSGSPRGGGVIIVGGMGSHTADAPVPPPAVALMPEHYNRIVRLLERGTDVALSVDVDAGFPSQHAEGANVIAELPGKRKRGEVVMMGSHFDSWHAGTGATDNATGCAVVMEALRILRALDLDLDRTVRIGLWDGEELGHLGSLAYVREHLGDTRTMVLKPGHEKFSVYYNIDTGTGRTRGILTQANDMVRPIFEQIMEPFAEHGITAIVPRNDWGTDHQSFDAVGLPAFDMLQDELDYWSHTWHSNLDTVDHVLPEDLMISAAFLATLAYHAATRDEMMPREAPPLPLPPPGPVPDILKD